MPKVGNVMYYTGGDGTLYRRGQELPPEEVERATSLGAIAGEAPPESGSLEGAFPPAGEVEDFTPPDDAPDEIDSLTGDDLDAACEAAGIDFTTGGSLKDGSMSAEEKRAALKAV